MKFLLSALVILNFSVNADVITKEYTGSNNGKACTLEISTGSEYGDDISLDECKASMPTNVKIVPKDGKIFIPRDYGHINEDKDCTIEVTLNKENVPTKAVMKAGGFFSPILLKKLSCKDLVLVK